MEEASQKRWSFGENWYFSIFFGHQMNKNKRFFGSCELNHITFIWNNIQLLFFILKILFHGKCRILQKEKHNIFHECSKLGGYMQTRYVVELKTKHINWWSLFNIYWSKAWQILGFACFWSFSSFRDVILCCFLHRKISWSWCNNLLLCGIFGSMPSRVFSVVAGCFITARRRRGQSGWSHSL